MINLNNAANLNKSQQVALRALINDVCGHKQEAAGHEIVWTVEVEPTEYGTAWVSLKQDIPTLSENNALRSFTRMDSWFVSIGKRGALDAHCYPNYARSFKGQRLGRINYK